MTSIFRFGALVLALLTAVALASCGDDADPASGPAALMPADAPVYIEAVVSPEGAQAESLNALTAKLGELPLIGTLTNPGDLIKGMIEDSASSSGVSLDFSEDVDPWLGERLGISYLSVADGSERFVAALETTDEGETEDALARILSEDAVPNEERTYEDVTYYTSGAEDYGVGVFSGHLVLATLDEFEAAVQVADSGESLADSDQLTEATAGLEDERLATLVLDASQFGELATSSPEELEKFEQVRAALPEFFDEPLSFALGVDERTIYLDQASPEVEGQPEVTESENFAEAPGDAFGAFGMGDIGGWITFVTGLYDRVAESGVALEEGYPEDGLAAAFEEETGVALDDLADAIGDGTVWVRGDLPDSLEIGSRISVSDEETVLELVDEIRDGAESEEGASAVGPPLDSDAEGFSVDFTKSDPTFEFERFNLEVGDGSLRVSLFQDAGSADSALPSETLGETDVFSGAGELLGADFELLGVADLAPIFDLALAEASQDLAVPFGGPEALFARFLTNKFEALALGARSADGRVIQRFALGIAE